MTIILIFSAAAGAIMGLRHFKVWALAPIILFAAAGVLANAVATGLDRRDIVLGLLMAVACPQICYLMTFIRSLIIPNHPRPDPQAGFALSSYNYCADDRIASTEASP